MSEEEDTPPKRTKSSISDDEDIEPPPFSPATLGLLRVGTLPPKPQPSQPIQMLNARGMPARVRKRNRLFFDDELVNDSKALGANLSPRKYGIQAKPSSPVKTPSKVLKKRKTASTSRFVRYDEQKNTPEKRSPGSKYFTSPTAATTSRNSLVPADKRMGQQIGLRLRNLLKLPKAHKWVIFEWFYSFVDNPLFEGENDFQICLNESFPNLKTRQLTRAEWQKVRSMMGKPRRCSQAFFEEERKELERKRQKIRILQTRKQAGDINNFIRDLPDKIPLPLPVGTKVTARLRVPQDGIFSGSVDAFDSLSSTYRVTFDRNGLGTHSIPDFEIVSDNFAEMLPLNSLMQDFRPRFAVNGNLIHTPSRGRNSLNRSDPLLGQQQFDSPFKNPVIERDTIGGFPVKLLETIVRLRRAIAIKKSKLNRLMEMNGEAEIKNAAAAASSSSSAGEHNLSEEFQRRYASIVISMEKMNRDMQDYLNGIQSFAGDLSRDPQVQAMLAPSYLREKCRESADDSVQRNNQGTVQDTQVLRLIKNLATVLLVASHLSSESNSQVTKVLEGCIEEVKAGLQYSDNVEVFQKHVQIHLHHIRLGIGQLAMTAARNVPNPALTGAGAGTSDESGRSTPV